MVVLAEVIKLPYDLQTNNLLYKTNLEFVVNSQSVTKLKNLEGKLHINTTSQCSLNTSMLDIFYFHLIKKLE